MSSRLIVGQRRRARIHVYTPGHGVNLGSMRVPVYDYVRVAVTKHLIDLALQARLIRSSRGRKFVHQTDIYARHRVEPLVLQLGMIHVHITVAVTNKRGGQRFQLVDDFADMQVSGVEDTVNAGKRLIYLGPQLRNAPGNVCIRDEAYAQTGQSRKATVDGSSSLAAHCAYHWSTCMTASTGGR